MEEDKNYTYQGTHVAGTIAAVDNDQGVIGLAPEAFLYSARIFDQPQWNFRSDSRTNMHIYSSLEGIIQSQ